MAKIDLRGLDKAAVLAALYDNARPQGLGFLHFTAEPLKPDEAAALLKQHTYFDYLKGRVMKVDLSGDFLDPALYDRDNGYGAAGLVIAGLRESKTTPQSRDGAAPEK